MAQLQAAGAQAIDVLAPGFVSASLERGCPSALVDIAEINVKPHKRPPGTPR